MDRFEFIIIFDDMIFISLLIIKRPISPSLNLLIDFIIKGVYVKLCICLILSFNHLVYV